MRITKWGFIMKRILFYVLFSCLDDLGGYAMASSISITPGVADNQISESQKVQKVLDYAIIPTNKKELEQYENWLQTYNTSEASVYLKVLILAYYHAMGIEKKEREYAKSFFQDLLSETDIEAIKDKVLFLPPNLKKEFYNLLPDHNLNNENMQNLLALISKDDTKGNNVRSELLNILNSIDFTDKEESL